MQRRIVAFLIVLTSSFAFAHPPRRAVRRHRAMEQQERIGQGVRSGELTREEAERLEAEQRAIREAAGVAHADGVVTVEERERLHQMRQEASENIREEKQDAEKSPKVK